MLLEQNDHFTRAAQSAQAMADSHRRLLAAEGHAHAESILESANSAIFTRAPEMADAPGPEAHGLAALKAQAAQGSSLTLFGRTSVGKPSLATILTNSNEPVIDIGAQRTTSTSKGVTNLHNRNNAMTIMNAPAAPRAITHGQVNQDSKAWTLKGKNSAKVKSKNKAPLGQTPSEDRQRHTLRSKYARMNMSNFTLAQLPMSPQKGVTAMEDNAALRDATVKVNLGECVTRSKATPAQASTLETNIIIAGDCAKVLTTFPSNSIDLTVTSPPYDGLRDYNGYEFNAKDIGKALLDVTKPGGVLVWVVSDHINGRRTMTSFRQALMFDEIGFHVHDVMVYQKKNTPFTRSNAYTNCWEFMLVLSKGGPPKTFNPLKTPTVRNGQEMLTHNKRPDGINKKRPGKLNPEKTRTNIWAYSPEETRENIWAYAVGYGGTTRDKEAFEHPAMFPEKLAEEHILSWSNPGDIVLDPMCGAGTTCKMALLNDRQYIGIDISKRYVEIARDRVANATTSRKTT